MQSSVGHSNALQKHSACGVSPRRSGICTVSSRGQPAPRSLQQQHRSQRSGCFVATHASNGSAANGASSLLKLSIPFATEFGDSVAVTTSTSGWSVEEAMPLTWGEGDIWHGELQAESGPLEYKYVVRRGAEVSEWQPGENLVVDVPREPAVLYIEDRWLNEERSVQMQTASSGLQASQASQPSGGDAAQPAPTATDQAAQATAAASANSPAAAAQQPMAAEPESEDAAVAAQRGNSLGKPLAKHTVKELKDLLQAAELPVTGKKAELIDRLIEAGY